MKFWGYKRPDGKVGIRNHVLILSASICASDTTRIIASQVEGAITFNNQNGCSQVPPDMKLTMDVLAGYAANPNIYGTVVVSLGCEGCQMDLVVEAIRERTNKPLKTLIIQEEGGTIKTVEKGVRYAQEMVAEAGLLRREEFPISELILGTNCGGSDPSSGLGSNPLVGELSALWKWEQHRCFVKRQNFWERNIFLQDVLPIKKYMIKFTKLCMTMRNH